MAAAPAAAAPAAEGAAAATAGAEGAGAAGAGALAEAVGASLPKLLTLACEAGTKLLADTLAAVHSKVQQAISAMPEKAGGVPGIFEDGSRARRQAADKDDGDIVEVFEVPGLLARQASAGQAGGSKGPQQSPPKQRAEQQDGQQQAEQEQVQSPQRHQQAGQQKQAAQVQSPQQQEEEGGQQQQEAQQQAQVQSPQQQRPGASAAPDEHVVLLKLYEVLRGADMNIMTYNTVQGILSAHFGVDLSDKKALLKEHVGWKMSGCFPGLRFQLGVVCSEALHAKGCCRFETLVAGSQGVCCGYFDAGNHEAIEVYCFGASRLQKLRLAVSQLVN